MPIWSLIQLALGLMNIVNFIMKQIDQNQWKQAGKAEAIADAIQQLADTTSWTKKLVKDVESKQDKDLDDILRS
jgi:hypothetical protein